MQLAAPAAVADECRALPVLLVLSPQRRVRASRAKDGSSASYLIPERAQHSDLRIINQRLSHVGVPEFVPSRSWRATEDVGAGGDRGGGDYWEDACRRRARGQIIGLVLIKLPGVRRSSTLSLASAEHRLLDRLYLPKAAHSLVFYDVIDAVSISNFTGHGLECYDGRLAPHYWLPSALGQVVHRIKGDLGLAVPGTCLLLQDVEAFRRAYGDQRFASAGTVSSVLRAWHNEWGCAADLGQVCLWTVWQPLAMLILHREWKVLTASITAAGSSIHTALFHDLPGLPSKATDTDAYISTTTTDLFASSRFSILADAIRAWAPALMQAPGAEGRLEFSESFLAGMADWADQATGASDSVSFARAGHGSRARFQAEFLVHSLLIASMLRKDGHLADVAESVMHAMLPPTFADWLRDSGLSFNELVPNAATVSRSRLPFVAAYACSCQDRWAALGDAGLFLQVDASPQFGRDWLIAVCTFVQRDRLPKLSEWLAELHRLAPSPDQAEDGTSDTTSPATLLRRKELAAHVSATFQHHILPAGGLGSGRSSLLHKLHCLLHSMALSWGSWDKVFRACSTVYAFTVDQGTEAGLRKVRRSVLSSNFLPSLFMDNRSGTMDNLMMDTSIGPEEHGPATNDDDPRDRQLQEAAAIAEPAVPGTPPDVPEAMVHEPDLLFPKAVLIPGALHILHSAAGEITDALEHFHEYLPNLRLIVDLLKHQWMRERFLATCLKTPEAAGYRHLFSTMVTVSLAEWRWGHLFHALSEVLVRMTPLRLFWSADQMLFKEGPPKPSAEDARDGSREHPAKESVASIRSITKVIQDPFFWAYSFLLHTLGLLVKDFELFCYSCACHPERAARFCRANESFSGVSRLTELLAGGSCCMAGRIAPSFATGEWRLKFDQFAATRSADMLQHCCSLTPGQRAQVVGDWGRGRSRLYMTMDVKFAFWDRLPHKLLGCSHDDREVARACAVQCNYLWTELLHAAGLDEVSAAAGNPGNFHPLIVDVFAGPLRCDFEDFSMNRKPLSSLPKLQELFTTLRLCIVIEVAVEGKHALAKLRVRQRKRAAPEMMNFELQIGEIRQWLRESPDNLSRMVGYFKEVYAPSQLLYKFGMMNHPYIQWNLQEQGRLRLREVAMAFFHCDTHAQFLDHSALMGTRGQNHLEPDIPEAGAPPKRTGLVLEDMIWRAALQHCAVTCDKGAVFSCSLAGTVMLERLSDRMQFQPLRIPGCVRDEGLQEYCAAIAPATPPEECVDIQMGPSTDACDMDNLLLAGDRSSGLLPAALARAPAALLAAPEVAECEAVAGAAETAIATVADMQLFFFRVAGQPHRMKRLRGSHGRDTRQHELAVTLHKALHLHIDHDARRAVIESDPIQPGEDNSGSPICLWSPCKGLSLPALHRTLLRWEISEELEFMWPESIKVEIAGHPVADRVVRELVAAGAIEVDEADYGTETQSVLDVWKDGSQAHRGPRGRGTGGRGGRGTKEGRPRLTHHMHQFVFLGLPCYMGCDGIWFAGFATPPRQLLNDFVRTSTTSLHCHDHNGQSNIHEFVSVLRRSLPPISLRNATSSSTQVDVAAVPNLCDLRGSTQFRTTPRLSLVSGCRKLGKRSQSIPLPRVAFVFDVCGFLVKRRSSVKPHPNLPKQTTNLSKNCYSFWVDRCPC